MRLYEAPHCLGTLSVTIIRHVDIYYKNEYIICVCMYYMINYDNIYTSTMYQALHYILYVNSHSLSGLIYLYGATITPLSIDRRCMTLLYDSV
jgi:hypothetical protein